MPTSFPAFCPAPRRAFLSQFRRSPCVTVTSPGAFAVAVACRCAISRAHRLPVAWPRSKQRIGRASLGRTSQQYAGGWHDRITADLAHLGRAMHQRVCSFYPDSGEKKMIPVHHGNIVRLWDESTPIAHIVGRGQRLRWRRRSAPISVQDASNARREAEYVARRNGIKAPLLQLWRVK